MVRMSTESGGWIRSCVDLEWSGGLQADQGDLRASWAWLCGDAHLWVGVANDGFEDGLRPPICYS